MQMPSRMRHGAQESKRRLWVDVAGRLRSRSGEYGQSECHSPSSRRPVSTMYPDLVRRGDAHGRRRISPRRMTPSTNISSRIRMTSNRKPLAMISSRAAPHNRSSCSKPHKRQMSSLDQLFEYASIAAEAGDMEEAEAALKRTLCVSGRESR